MCLEWHGPGSPNRPHIRIIEEHTCTIRLEAQRTISGNERWQRWQLWGIWQPHIYNLRAGLLRIVPESHSLRHRLLIGYSPLTSNSFCSLQVPKGLTPTSFMCEVHHPRTSITYPSK